MHAWKLRIVKVGGIDKWTLVYKSGSFANDQSTNGDLPTMIYQHPLIEDDLPKAIYKHQSTYNNISIWLIYRRQSIDVDVSNPLTNNDLLTSITNRNLSKANYQKIKVDLPTRINHDLPTPIDNQSTNTLLSKVILAIAIYWRPPNDNLSSLFCKWWSIDVLVRTTNS